MACTGNGEKREVEYTHIPVLLNEVLSFVNVDVSNYVVVDMTLGRAGHSSKILEKLNKSFKFYGFDRDSEAINYCQEKLRTYGDKIHLFHSPFSKAIDILKEEKVEGADFILYDIGVSSPQFDDPRRGFSYRFDAPLDMRMDQTQSLDAKKIVNEYSENDLARILSNNADEPFARQIAHQIVKSREEKPILTTFELVDVIKKGLPERVLHKKGHPAKKTFMALRYEVNDEKNELINSLKKSIKFLKPQGILLVISFNSEEDRLVKSVFKSFLPTEVASRYYPMSENEKSDYVILTKKPILASNEELERNPRSESALMRVIQKI